MWLGGTLRAQVLDRVRAAIKASTVETAHLRILVTGEPVFLLVRPFPGLYC